MRPSFWQICQSSARPPNIPPLPLSIGNCTRMFFLIFSFFYNAEGAVAGEGGWSHVGLFISSKMIRLTCKSPSCGLLVSIAHKRQQFPVPATASGSFSPTALHRFYAAMAAFFLFYLCRFLQLFVFCLCPSTVDNLLCFLLGQ